MNTPLKKGDQILVSTETDPELGLLGDILVCMFVVEAPDQSRALDRTRFTCALPIDSRSYFEGLRFSLWIEDEGVTWARGWDRNSKRAFRAMLMLRTA